MKKILAAFAIAVLSSTAAHAGFLIEPYLGYETGEDNGTPANDYAGMFYGLRAGGSTMGFIYGVDVQMGSGELDTTPAADLDFSDMGLFVGYEFPIMLRVYASYFLKSEADTDAGTYAGTGTRIGVGYTGLPFVAINFEILARSYDEFEDVALGSDTEIDTMGLSISVPLP
jgi:hypothetical protein